MALRDNPNPNPNPNSNPNGPVQGFSWTAPIAALAVLLALAAAQSPFL